MDKNIMLVYPNPAIDIFTISFPNTETSYQAVIELVDMIGRVFKKQNHRHQQRI
jgi:hypothetical protein